MLRVLVIHNHYQRPGGEAVAVRNETDLLRQRGHPVIEFTRDNHQIESYSLLQKGLFFPRALFCSETYHAVKELIAQEKPDIAHVHNVFPLISPSVYYALRESGIPVVQTVHNYRFLCPNGLFYTHGTTCERCKRGNTWHAVRLRCYRKSYALSAMYALTIGLHRRLGTFGYIDRYIALTEFAAQKLVESGLVGQEHIQVLGNFLPDPLPRPAQPEERRLEMAYLGRLSPEKGIEVLLEAASRVPELTVTIAGDGPLRQQMHDFTRTHRMSNVRFLGHVDGEDKWRLLRRVRAIVIPSLCFENHPFVLLESQTVGTPVVASRTGSIGSLVEDGRTGWLFPPGDSVSLERILRRLVSSDLGLDEMSVLARRRVEERYSAAAHYERLISIYTHLVH